MAKGKAFDLHKPVCITLIALLLLTYALSLDARKKPKDVKKAIALVEDYASHLIRE